MNAPRIITATFVSLLVCTFQTWGQHIAAGAIEKARAELHRAVDAGEIAGGSFLVGHRGQVACFEAAGFSDVEDKTPFRRDTIVRIYSMSKPITSVAAMVLYEQGKFALDDPVAEYIPAFQKTTVVAAAGSSTNVVPAKRPITIRDVFRHTTGYSYGGEAPVRQFYEKAGLRYRGPLGMYPPEMTIEQAAEKLARIPALHHPGERFTYGFNTDLLGRLIEVWSGDSLEDFLKKTLFEPLEMRDTGFSVPRGKRDLFASCHTTRDGKLAIADKAADSPFNEGFKFASGGGGLVSTIGDYANFCQMLVDGGVFEGRRILKSETVKLMFSDQLDGVAGDFRFGLGFRVSKIPVGSTDNQRQVAEYSWGGYASTDFRLVPEERLFQIMFRQHIPTSNKLANKLFSIIYEGVE